MALSFQQIEGLEEARGATPQQAAVGAAIVEAESGGNPTAWGDRSLGPGAGQYVGSRGIWQIYGAAHPSVSQACAEDPNCATDVARQISSNWTNWHPWSTFNSGAYLHYIQGGGPAQGGGGGGTGSDASLLSTSNPLGGLLGQVGTVWNRIKNLTGATSAAEEAIFSDLIWRSGLILVGIALVLIGTTILFRPIVTEGIGLGARTAGVGRIAGSLT